MIFEGGHVAKHPLVHEMGEGPFPCFLDVWAGRVNALAKLIQDRLCEIGGAGDVCVRARVCFSHGNHPFQLT